ncbi:MAG: N-6 DNA methylase [Burkholderiaceae bacterium]
MTGSASDAGGSERELRKKLLDTGAVDVIVAVGPNMFFTVTPPMWFLDRGKSKGPRADQVLFIDARHLYRQVTRALRVFNPETWRSSLPTSCGCGAGSGGDRSRQRRAAGRGPSG